MPSHVGQTGAMYGSSEREYWDCNIASALLREMTMTHQHAVSTFCKGFFNLSTDQGTEEIICWWLLCLEKSSFDGTRPRQGNKGESDKVQYAFPLGAKPIENDGICRLVEQLGLTVRLVSSPMTIPAYYVSYFIWMHSASRQIYDLIGQSPVDNGSLFPVMQHNNVRPPKHLHLLTNVLELAQNVTSQINNASNKDLL